MLRAAGGALRQALGFRGAGQQLLGSQAFRAFGAPAGHHDDHDDDHHEPSYDHTPTVFDNLVTINVVDLQGHRHAIRGLVGKSLSQTLIEAGFPAVDAHVLIPKDYWSKIPNFADDSDEADAIKRTFRDIIQDHARDTSFLASYVKLVPEMNNMTIGIGAIKPWILHTDWGFGGVHDDPTPQFEKKTVEIHA